MQTIKRILIRRITGAFVLFFIVFFSLHFTKDVDSEKKQNKIETEQNQKIEKLKQLPGDIFKIPIAENTGNNDVFLEENIVNKQLTVQFPQSCLKTENVPENIHNQHIKSQKWEKSNGVVRGIFTFDKVYAFEKEVGNQNIYIQFMTPKEKYDKIVVVDAGHGGKDYGCYNDMAVEKEVNLKVVLKMKEIMDLQTEIKVYYTRLFDELYATKDLIGAANSISADLFLSVHCNFFKNGPANGIETYYHSTDPVSQKLAETGQQKLVKELGFADRGLLNGDKLSVIHHAKVPSALFELGFLSSRQNAEILMSDDGQSRAAKALCDTIKEMENR